MTNSTPKSNNRIERQGSPNHYHHHQGGKKSGGRSLNCIKTATYFASSNSNSPAITAVATPISAATSNNNGGGGGGRRNGSRSSGAARLGCTSPNNASSTPPRGIPRSSPMRNETPRGSPTNSFYAGAKFSEPPSPASVPKPPSHWTGSMGMGMGGCHPNILAQHLKMLVHAQA
ncbi:proline-rich nuclear receptor coactivator 2-like [Copidosoma floridanum]|uniref:proline-rich nuclear receptor coactivator 2-like n=1 Tax=Copidosoma floridanum TaxID=29053 RepID=UPI0006C9A395|nr:proline-rich nuclear receptor coactivator 2-like [Copidosoma floridanum]XP_014206118.1 proline-rich nuclear receptor coactivator 2-like [Copidosoma floridanum]